MSRLPWFYPDRVSAEPGEVVRLFAGAPASPCRLTVTRLGAEPEQVTLVDELTVGDHPVPPKADTHGCGWPECASFEIGADWPSGYYDLELADPSGASTRHFVCVRPSRPAAEAVVVLATNTYQAYNYWGGANSYAHVEALMAGELDPPAAREAAIGRLSRLRPYAQPMFAPPPGAPRLVNLERREVGQLALPGTAEWLATHNPSPYDGSAGFRGKWEHVFLAWCEQQGYRLDVVTDHDFEDHDDLLAGYSAVFLVGHSEYWSASQRRQLDDYVTAGGNLAVLSGNSGYWKVRWEDGGDTLVAHKWKGDSLDPLWAEPDTRPDATHLWSHPEFGRPEAEVTGLSFLYGGYHRLAMCVARGSAAYTVYRDRHWALEGTDLFYGDTFGGDVPLIGYENDGCPLRFGGDGLPEPDGGVGIPDHLEVIAFAPATMYEPPESPFPPIIPPEEVEVAARVAYGSSDAGAVERLGRGHAVLATFTKGDGEVFNAGTTEWVHGLAAGDTFVEQITHNVMRRFGVST